MSNDAFYSSPEWRRTAKAVTTGARCVRCGGRRNLVAHHVLPRADGGSDTPDNLCPACRRCHPTVETYSKALAAILTPYASGQPAPYRPASKPAAATYGAPVPKRNALIDALLAYESQRQEANMPRLRTRRTTDYQS